MNDRIERQICSRALAFFRGRRSVSYIVYGCAAAAFSANSRAPIANNARATCELIEPHFAMAAEAVKQCVLLRTDRAAL